MLYDLVVIGNTEEAILAAIKASYLKDRVALVYSHSMALSEAYDAIFNRRFTHLNNKRDINFSYLDNLTDFTQELLSQVLGADTLALLASIGIDVIQGVGEFFRLPKLGFRVNNYNLYSPFYLIATGSDSVISPILGSETVGYLTDQDILAKNLELLPDKLLIIGSNSQLVILAQNLNKIGKNITLIVETKQLLPEFDRDCSSLIQAQLESEGIAIFINTSVRQIKSLDGKKWVQAGNKALLFDEIIITDSHKKPKVEGLNLEGVRVKFDFQGILVNEKLQTTNKRIYACGSVTKRNNSFHSVEVETDTVIHNALIFPWEKINYHKLPTVLYTNPTIATIGLTENQARVQYKDNIFVAREYYKNIPAAQILEATTGFCKLIARKNGTLLGAQIVGVQAEELISIISLAMNNKITLGKLANLPLANLTLSEIISHTAKQWQKQHIRKNRTLLELINIISKSVGI